MPDIVVPGWNRIAVFLFSVVMVMASYLTVNVRSRIKAAVYSKTTNLSESAIEEYVPESGRQEHLHMEQERTALKFIHASQPTNATSDWQKSPI